jgi:hypothetical protein
VRLSVDDFSGNGLSCGGNIKCERSVVGTQVTCVGMYKNGTPRHNAIYAIYIVKS